MVGTERTLFFKTGINGKICQTISAGNNLEFNTKGTKIKHLSLFCTFLQRFIGSICCNVDL